MKSQYFKSLWFRKSLKTQQQKFQLIEKIISTKLLFTVTKKKNDKN
jgi:hypothetical protein